MIIDSITYGDVTPVIVGIEEDINPVIPNEVHLYQNYPNPFNPQTTIRFFLNKSVTVSLTIYDTSGKEVMRLLVDERFSPGSHEVTWNGETRAGQPAASGVYFYRLTANAFTQTNKMMLLK